MVKLITPDMRLAELNRVVDQHNRMAADFLRCLVILTRQLALQRRALNELLEENNRLLSLAQRVLALQDENDHLYYVISELDRRLWKYEG